MFLPSCSGRIIPVSFPNKRQKLKFYFLGSQPERTYTWADDGTAISIVIQIDANVTSARVDVKIMSNTVRAGIKGDTPILQVEKAANRFRIAYCDLVGDVC